MTSGVYTSGFRPPAGFRSPQHCRHRRMCLAWPEGRSLKTPWFALRCRRTRRHVDRAPPLDVTPAAFSTKSKASPCLPLRPSARPSPQTRTIGGLAPPPSPIWSRHPSRMRFQPLRAATAVSRIARCSSVWSPRMRGTWPSRYCPSSSLRWAGFRASSRTLLYASHE